MYKAFFGLKELPFRNNLDSSFFYEKASRLEILQALVYVINRGDAIIKVTGEVGSGKTTLLRLVAQDLTNGYKLVYINSPNLSPKDLLHSIATELDIQFSDEINKYQLLELIRNDLLTRYVDNKKVVVLVDEAQSISIDTLEELRLLTNFETDKDKLIQLVLFGQPELELAIGSPVLRQLKSRITYSIHIPPLTISDVYDYLNHRMRVASYKGLDFFNYKNAKKIHKLSQGLPRTINSIADQLLMSSYGLGDTKLKTKHFKNLNSLDLYSPKVKNNYLLLSFIFLILVLISVGGYFLFINKPDGDKDLVSINDIAIDLPVESQELDVFDNVISSELIVESIPLLKEDIGTVDITSQSASVEQTDANFLSKENSILDQVAIDSSSEITMNQLLELHFETEAWLDSFSNTDYIIQLSTSSVDKFKKNIASYNSFKNVMTNLHFMLALNQEGTAMRIKTLYLGSSSYSFLRKELSVLPESIKKAQPFIANASTLKESAKSTSLKLKVMESQ
ncbi:MAG: AAA family ATPase [Pseudomonadota bacterium]|nr:AAA family ATPase [Pseudomonadota bacterium]